MGGRGGGYDREERRGSKQGEGSTSGVSVSASKWAATAAQGEPSSCASWLKLGREAGAKSRHARMASHSAEGQDDGRALISSGSSFSTRSALMMSPAESP